MSVYCGIKPIVSRGLSAFVNGLNIQSFSGSDYIKNNDLTLYVGDADYQKNKRKFYLNGNVFISSSANADILNYYGDGNKTYSIWFKPYETKGFIFEKGLGLNLFLSKSGKLSTYFRGNRYSLLQGIDISGKYLYILGNRSNVFYSFLVVDKDNLQVEYAKTDPSRHCTFISSYHSSVRISGSEVWYSNLSFIAKTKLYPEWITDAGIIVKQWKYSSAYPPSTNASNIFHFDLDNDYIYTTNYNGAYIVKTDKHTLTHVTESKQIRPYGLCIDPFDSESLYYTSENKLYKAYRSTLVPFLETGSFSSLRGIRADENYVYACDYYNHLVKKIDKNTFELTQSYTLNYPMDVCLSGSYLYCISYYGKIVILDKNTMTLVSEKYLSTTINYDNYLYGPKLVFFNEPNNIYTLGRSKVFSWFKPDNLGNPILKSKYVITDTHIGDSYGLYISGSFEWTGGLEAHAYIVGGERHTVAKYSMSLNPEITLTYVTHSGTPGTAGSGTYLYNYPQGIAVTDEYVFVADKLNYRIKKLRKSDLNLIDMMNTQGKPWGITVSGSYIFYASEHDRSIRRIDFDMTSDEIMYYVGVACYDIQYDKYTNRFYAKANYGRKLMLFDSNFNVLVNNDHFNGSEIIPDYISYSIFPCTVSDKHFISADNNTMIKFFNKEDLYYENQSNAFIDSKIIGTVNTGSWYNVTIVFNKDYYKTYINGEFQVSSSIYKDSNWGAWSIINNSNLKIGRGNEYYTYTPENIKMDFGALLIYDTELTDSEIKQNYDALKWEFK